MPKVHINENGEKAGAIWTKEEIEFAIAKFPVETIKDISKSLNRPFNGVAKKIRQFKIKKDTITERYLVNVVYRGQVVQRYKINQKSEFIKAMQQAYFDANPALRRGEKILVELEPI